MDVFETDRLILREFTQSDFTAVHSYASNPDNLIYMPWGPNSVEETTAFLDHAIAASKKIPRDEYRFAVIRKGSNLLIGACSITVSNDQAEIGWILHMDYWKYGFGAEIGKALLAFGFGGLDLHRIVAYCDATNYGSYQLMEKIGMRREGYFHEARQPNKKTDEPYSDEAAYAILQDEWLVDCDIAHYNQMSYTFDSFITVPTLADGEFFLVCRQKSDAVPEKRYSPDYSFLMCIGSECVGEIDLRIGMTDSLYFSGHIGYNVREPYRGNGYAGRACQLLLPVAKAHGFDKLLITNEYTNEASKRVCEKLGATFVRKARLPEWHDLYVHGQRFVNVFEWSIG